MSRRLSMPAASGNMARRTDPVATGGVGSANPSFGSMGRSDGGLGSAKLGTAVSRAVC